LLGKSSIRRRAARIGEQLRREDGLKNACDALEALKSNR
jgi:UDP:flavonoid glycosyltransferase YjiC (YdhE family)